MSTELSHMTLPQRNQLGPCSVPILLEEPCGIPRIHDPVTVGIPLPRGAVSDPDTLALHDEKSHPVPLQVQVLARWPDGSLKWALLDFQATIGASTTVAYALRWGSPPTWKPQPSPMRIHEDPQGLIIDTGGACFSVDRHTFRPFAGVVVRDVEFIDRGGSQIVLLDASGRIHTPCIGNIRVEARGPLRTTVSVEGAFRSAEGIAFADFIGRLSLYAGRSLARIQLTIRNPRAARHRNGLWDLGDEGSVYFRDLSLHMRLLSDKMARIAWTVHPGRPLVEGCSEALEIYQDSSGGRNWHSSNHVNRFGEMRNTFPGYRVTADGRVERGARASPAVSLGDGERWITGAVQRFWQTFPKAIEARDNTLTIRLFPTQYADVFELQAGEQKTHTVFLEFTVGQAQGAALQGIQSPLIPPVTPEGWCRSRVLPYLTPSDEDPNVECLALLDAAIKGENTFFDRREVIDEYGWRHFGDLYADHEAVGHRRPAPLVAHYNNQYDVIYGAIVQFARSGDRRWFQLADELAWHVIDIDIYHTKRDRPGFNGGLFWHTEHYRDAATATHRAYSRASSNEKAAWLCGGGPSNEHNYTSGLLHYYHLTGEPAAREVVLGLAEWVLDMDDGSRTAWGILDRRPTGLASQTAAWDYHGPGRGAANSINALLDAYSLTQDRRYLAKAEELVRRCIHPHDSIGERKLEDVEKRWSYLVFLQTLGKYLDSKSEWAERDFMYAYARASLLHYATWMLDHESPYKQVMDRVKIPTETWSAQDIRKSNVFHLAAKYAQEPLRGAFRQRADFFFRACITDLLSFPTRTLTRPIVLLMTNGFMHAYFMRHPDERNPLELLLGDGVHTFGEPRSFTPQFYALHKARERLRRLVSAARSVARRAQERRGA